MFAEAPARLGNHADVSTRPHLASARRFFGHVVFVPACIVIFSLIATPSLWSAAPQQALSSESARTAVVTSIASPISIDGVLDEPVWKTSPKIGNLIQREPLVGQQPSESTEVVLLRDANNLYIGVICNDSEPNKIAGTQMARDGNVGSDDRITMVLDTYRDQRNAFYFQTNAVGALVDGLVFANGQSNSDWDAIWNVRTRRTEVGWTAEFAIPFKSLGFPAGSSVWGFNIARNIPRKSEEDRWSGARLQVTQFFQVSEAGEITGLEGLSQGIGMDVRPFVGGRWLHTKSTGRNNFNGKPGVDLFYNFTPSLKLSATVNTDFGETEADARQINLSRFSVLFPEKRAFFLEDVGVFNFASTGTADQPAGVPSTGSEIYPFFSRQIGLLNGEEVPIDFGLKLTGKIGRTEIGVLDVRTRDLPTVSEKNFVVLRAKQNFFEQSYIGGIFTRGNPALPISSTTVGADMRLATSHFMGRRNLVFNTFAIRSINEGNSDRNMTYGFSARYPNDKYDAQIVWREIQSNFRPALGFVQRRNVRLLRFGGSYNPRPMDFLGVQQMFHDFYYMRFTRLDNKQVESWNFFATMLDWHFRSGDALHSVLDVDSSYERLFSPFTIFPGVVLPVGEYRFTRGRVNFMTAPRRRISVNFNWSYGPYWSGHADTLQTGITFRVPPQFSISLNTNQTFARLPQGNFVARIFTSNINYSATPVLSFFNLIQYDNQSHNLGWQSRARWTLRPGNDLFIVFGQGWIQEPQGGFHFNAQDTKLSTKFQYTFRL